MKNIKSEDEFNTIISKKNTIIDCYTDWCGPCKLFGPIFEQCEDKYNDINFCKLNVDKNKILAKKLGIMSIPTIILFKNGGELKRLVGFIDSDNLDKLIKESF